MLHVFQLSIFEALVTLPTKKENVTCEWKIIILMVDTSSNGWFSIVMLVFRGAISVFAILPAFKQPKAARSWQQHCFNTPQQNTHLGHLSMICQRKLSSVVELTCCTILLILDVYIQVQRCVVVFINISTGKVGMKATQRRPAPEPNLYLTKFGQLNYFE